MQTFVFLDLDGTIFQTAPKCPPDAVLRPVAFRRDGVALSFMTQGQEAFFRLLAASGRVVPVTGRNLDSFRRVNLPFCDMAVLDFGGVVLMPDGTPNEEWDACIRPLALSLKDRLESGLRSMEAVNSRRQLGVSARLISDFGMPLYLVAKHPSGNLDALAVMASECAPQLEADGFVTHSNENNLSFMAGFLGKERAVKYLIERHLGAQPSITVGIGDSFTDAAFMSLCDYSLVPRGSQLASKLTGEPV